MSGRPDVLESPFAGIVSHPFFARFVPFRLPSNLRHYEMLKLHHMNLLNEIQETTLMMNLYQQQQLQHQQQQLQQQASAELGGVGGVGASDSQLSMLMHQQSGGGLDPLFGASQLQQRGSLGLGGGPLGNFGGGQPAGQVGSMQGMNQQQVGGAAGSASSGGAGSSGANANIMGAAANEEMQNRMNALTAEITRAENSKMPASAAGSSEPKGSPETKRSGDGDDAGSPSKRQKTENSSAENEASAGAGSSDAGKNAGGSGQKESK